MSFRAFQNSFKIIAFSAREHNKNAGNQTAFLFFLLYLYELKFYIH